jgi:hypothetical protein
MLTILVPTNAAQELHAERAARRSSLHGLRLGILDNGKPNSDRFLELLADNLVGTFGVRITTRLKKPAIGRLAPPEMVEQLVSNTDVTVTGVGDCAGCCSCTVADAVTLEQLGIPVAAICTSEFATAAALAATSAGLPGYDVVVLPHPFGSCTDAVLAERATSLADRIEALLTDATRAAR